MDFKSYEIMRIVTGIIALFLLTLVFVTSSLTGQPPDDTLIAVLNGVIMSYLMGDVVSAYGSHKRNNDNEK